MATPVNSPKPHRFRRWLDRKENLPQPQSESGSSNVAESMDTQRARDRHIEAVKILHSVVSGRKNEWADLDVSGLKGELEDVTSLQFRQKLDAVLDAKWKAQKDHTSWKKCSYAMQSCFIAFSPFAKNFLRIATNVQSVSLFTIESSF